VQLDLRSPREGRGILIAEREDLPEESCLGSLTHGLGTYSGLPSFSTVGRRNLFRSPFSDNPLLKQGKNDSCAVFIERTDDVRDGVCVVDEEVTDRHRSFGLVVKIAGIWRQGEFVFPDMETISILRYGLSHRKFLLSLEERRDILHCRVVLGENTLYYRHHGGNPYLGSSSHCDSCGRFLWA
jgi:hypothetical protein